ncbi:MAG: hypothetical protein M1822_008115 [Bathelium mastoideum]|nr:MAG: hypothetical protein M1822_008115 [Bathelium mastoideum]
MISPLSQSRRDIFQEEGIYIGGWSLQHVLIPAKKARLDGIAGDDVKEKALAEQDWSKDEETRLRRKLDRRVLLPCCIIYFLALLDRANLGNVKILQQGTPDSLKSSLHLHGTQFNWAVSISYFAVTALLIPSNLLMKRISAKWYFPFAMVLWGTVVMSFAAVQNAGGLFAARFVLGIPESGVVPCCIMYFSFWYKPSERAFRIGVFHSAGSLAAAVSGFLALAIDNLNGKGGLKAWQWVFIIEGSMPIILAPLLWLCLLTFPEDTKALSDRERYIAINRFGRGSARRTDVTWSWSTFRRIFTRPSTYAFFVSYVSLGIVASAQGTFLPTFLSTFLHFSISKSNLYTAICKLTIIPLYWFYGLHSDWTHERMWHYILPVVIAMPRYAVWTYASSHPAHTMSNISLYGLSYLGQMVQVSQPILLSYRTATLYGACEQAVGGAAAVASGSIAAILAPQLYPEQHAPGFLPGFSATCGLLVLCIVSYLTLPIWLEWEAADRKAKTGHALPMQAVADAERAQVSGSGFA